MYYQYIVLLHRPFLIARIFTGAARKAEKEAKEEAEEIARLQAEKGKLEQKMEEKKKIVESKQKFNYFLQKKFGQKSLVQSRAHICSEMQFK